MKNQTAYYKLSSMFIYIFLNIMFINPRRTYLPSINILAVCL